MKLTPEQKEAVAQWLAEEATIADVQKRLRDEFGISMTFMETRFLIDDLGLDIKDAPKPGADVDTAATPDGAPASGTDAEAELVDDDAPAGGTGGVSVEVDQVTRPGAAISGTVTFSDGKSGHWALDQYGRIVFQGSDPEYRPSQADLEAFQRELSAKLERHGY
ncbi:MAG: hypothetical protein D6781_07205 [Verrucomicrobia bacterium]|nr:MAG: hypothetical protein D6781_07205 [Verrucomicrobiota bacterium]